MSKIVKTTLKFESKAFDIAKEKIADNYNKITVKPSSYTSTSPALSSRSISLKK